VKKLLSVEQVWVWSVSYVMLSISLIMGFRCDFGNEVQIFGVELGLVDV
jgi:hypothetical protein